MQYVTSGIIRYDPPRPGMRNRTDYWAIAQVDRGLTKYYRWWAKKLHGVILNQPSWDAHVSIIRGKGDVMTSNPRHAYLDLWKKYEGKKVEIRYDNEMKKAQDKKNNGEFWFLIVDAPELMKIREEMGLKTTFPLHLTFGRTYY